VAALFENLEDGVSLAEFVELFPGVTEHGCGIGLKADPAGSARVLRRWEPSCREEGLEPARIP